MLLYAAFEEVPNRFYLRHVVRLFNCWFLLSVRVLITFYWIFLPSVTVYSNWFLYFQPPFLQLTKPQISQTKKALINRLHVIGLKSIQNFILSANLHVLQIIKLRSPSLLNTPLRRLHHPCAFSVFFMRLYPIILALIINNTNSLHRRQKREYYFA